MTFGVGRHTSFPALSVYPRVGISLPASKIDGRFYFLISAEVHIKESKIGKAYFTGGPFAGNYLASIFHLHWGPDDSSGSDHSFKGKFYPAEVLCF